MANCAGPIPWTSTVTRQGVGVVERATFTIDTEDANGNFVGSFQVQGSPVVEQIAGHCSGADITFVRPAGAPPFRYEGIFVFAGPVLIASGKRTQVGFPPDVIQAAFAESASQPDAARNEEKKEADRLAARALVATLPLVPDDWTGERT